MLPLLVLFCGASTDDRTDDHMATVNKRGNYRPDCWHDRRYIFLSQGFGVPYKRKSIEEMVSSEKLDIRKFA